MSSRDRWQSIRRIVNEHRDEGRRVLVVCSAVSGVTNALESMLAAAQRAEPMGDALDALWTRHVSLARELGLCGGAARTSGAEMAELARTMTSLRRLLIGLAADARVTPADHAEVMAHGELLSTRLGAAFLRAQGLDVEWRDVRHMLHAQPVPEGSSEAQQYLSATCDVQPDAPLYAALEGAAPIVVTQGFIASNAAGSTVLLGRGGSDTSAAYLASKLRAARLEIWTDVHGMFTANPNAVPTARLVPALTYFEAQSLSGLGAKVLHPRCLSALHDQHIPLKLGATQRPLQGGTTVNGFAPTVGAKAIVSRNGLCLLAMRRPRQWQPIGFMADVASCFRQMGLSMDLVTSCPGEIRATIDVAAFPDVMGRMDQLLAALGQVSEVELTTGLSSVSLVGHQLMQDAERYAAATSLMHGAPARLVAHAADDSSLTYVVDRSAADDLVRSLHGRIFERIASASLGPSWLELTQGEAPKQVVA